MDGNATPQQVAIPQSKVSSVLGEMQLEIIRLSHENELLRQENMILRSQVMKDQEKEDVSA